MSIQISAPPQPITHISKRSLFARHIGHVLTSLGAVFLYLPPFNDHIEESTGQLLISIGRKLSSTE